MNIKHLILCVVAAVTAASCSKQDLSGFDAPESAYRDAKVQETVTGDLTLRLDQKYRTQDITLAELGVSPSEDAVFYAPSKDSDWCGKDWYTSEYGFYMTGTGYACQRAEAKFFVEYHPAGTAGYRESVVSIGQIPDACTAGETYTLTFGFATPSEKQPVTLTVSVLENLPWAAYKEHPDGLTYTVYQEVNTDYTALDIPINEDAVKNALGLGSLTKLLDAMQSDTAYDTTMRGVNSDGSYDTYAKYTANVAGYWFNQNGDVCEWKGEKWGAYIEWDRTSPMIFRLGQAVENNVVGSRYDMKIALICEGKEAILTFKLKIVYEVTDDLGLLQ